MRKIEIERKAWNRRGHWFGFYFAICLPVGLWIADQGFEQAKGMLGWATLCLGIAIFCWYKGSE